MPGGDTSSRIFYDTSATTYYFIGSGSASRAKQLTGRTTTASILTWSFPENTVCVVGGNLTITAYTSGTIVLQVSWTDESSAARTATLTSGNSAASYNATPITITVKAATVVTVQTTGTFSATYNTSGFLTVLGG